MGREPGKASIELGSQCALRAKAHAKGLLISCRNAKISNEVGGELPTISDYLRIAAEFDWVVTRRGEFVGLTNTGRLMAALWKTPGPSQQSMQERLRLEPMMLSLSEAEARSTWAMLVENWTDTSLTLGEVVSGESASELPLVPGAAVHRRDSVTAERWLPCPGRPQTRCIELRSKSVVDPSDVSAAIDSFPNQGAAASPPSAPTRMEALTIETALVTDPATLMPYSLVVTTQSSSTRENGLTSSKVVEKRWTFTYSEHDAASPKGSRRE